MAKGSKSVDTTEKPLSPALERLIEALAEKAVADYIAERERPATDTLLRLPEVMRRVGIKKTTIYARIASGTFPKPTTDGGVSRWFESEIDEYVTGLKARRDAES